MHFEKPFLLRRRLSVFVLSLLPFCSVPAIFAQPNALPSSGSVGIGTRRPARSLHIVTAQGAELLLEGANGLANYRRWSLYLGSGPGEPKALYLRMLNDASTASTLNSMIWTPTGNVGIGNMNPVAQVSVSGKGQRGAAISNFGDHGGMILANATDMGPGSGGALLFGIDGGAFGNNGFFAAIKGLHTDGSNHQAGDLAIALRKTSRDAVLTERLRLTQNGDLGLGLTLPIAKLHVAGDMAATNGGALHLSQGHSEGVWGVRIAARQVAQQGEDLVVRTRESASGPFRDAMIIQANGFVGIGTTQPDRELTVNGTVHAKDVLVAWSAKAEVFGNAYPLLSLGELDQYIRVHGELPDTSKGDNRSLALTNRILQQKVEELTLYILAINKRLEALETQAKLK